MNCQQSQRAINMYEQERKRREEQDILLEKATRKAEELERELNELKAKTAGEKK
jgi:hypothetical protein